MTFEEQKIALVQINEKADSIMLRKGNDYASNADRLSNFKDAARIANITVDKQFLSLIATKVARLGQLTNVKDSIEFESVEDTLLDLRNYATLYIMYLQESK